MTDKRIELRQMHYHLFLPQALEEQKELTPAISDQRVKLEIDKYGKGIPQLANNNNQDR